MNEKIKKLIKKYEVSIAVSKDLNDVSTNGDNIYIEAHRNIALVTMMEIKSYREIISELEELL